MSTICACISDTSGDNFLGYPGTCLHVIASTRRDCISGQACTAINGRTHEATLCGTYRFSRIGAASVYGSIELLYGNIQLQFDQETNAMLIARYFPIPRHMKFLQVSSYSQLNSDLYILSTSRIGITVT